MSIRILFFIGVFFCLGHSSVLSKGLHMLSKSLFEEAQVLVEKSKFIEADLLLTQSLVADPSFGPAFFLKGYLALQNKKPERAHHLIATGLSLNPLDVQGTLWAGETALALDDRESAEKYLNRLQFLCQSCQEYRKFSMILESYKEPNDG